MTPTADLVQLWALGLRRARRHADLLRAYDLAPPTPERVQRVLQGRASVLGSRQRVFDGPLETLLGILPIRPCGRGGFDLAEDGTPAVIQAVTDLGCGSPYAICHVIDLLAWHPARPDETRLLTGTAQWLGAFPPHLADDGSAPPLTIVASPREWLQRPETLCVLDWSVDTVGVLAPWGGETVVFTSIEVAERFKTLTEKARLPWVGVEAA